MIMESSWGKVNMIRAKIEIKSVRMNRINLKSKPNSS